MVLEIQTSINLIEIAVGTSGNKSISHKNRDVDTRYNDAKITRKDIEGRHQREEMCSRN